MGGLTWKLTVHSYSVTDISSSPEDITAGTRNNVLLLKLFALEKAVEDAVRGWLNGNKNRG